VVYYADNGTVTAYPEGSAVDLEEYIGPLPDKSQGDQQAKIDRLRAEWQAEFTAAQQLRSEGDRLRAEIERLQTELQQSEARNTADAETAEYAARLEMQLDNSREALRDLQEDHTAMDNRAEGARSAYLAVIKTLWEMRR
jgi:chromosome segregation ATPase